MHEPADSPALPGTPLSVPVHSGLAEAFGYPGDACFVGFFWEPGGDEVIYADGRLSGTGASYIFLTYRRHAAVSPHLQPYNLGYSDQQADHWLLIDRQERRASIAPKGQARAFLEEQHPPPPELTPYELEEARREVESFAEALAGGWQEVQIDPKALAQAMRQQHQTIARLTAYLDQWHADERNTP